MWPIDVYGGIMRPPAEHSEIEDGRVRAILGFKDISAMTDVENKVSRHILEKLGFRFVEIFAYESPPTWGAFAVNRLPGTRCISRTPTSTMILIPCS